MDKPPILNILLNIYGPKVLVLDRDLDHVFNILTNYKKDALESCGVLQKEYLDVETLNPKACTIVYFVRCNYSVGKLLRQHLTTYLDHNHQIYFSPIRSLMVERSIESHGINNYNFHDLTEINLVPIDNILSMDYNDRSIDDLTIPYHIACHIKNYGTSRNNKIQPTILGIGSISSRIANIFQHNFVSSYEKFDRLILVDRQCDLINPLLTQDSYRGVLSELHPIYFTKYNLQKDAIYSELYNMNFSDVGAILRSKTKTRFEAEDNYKNNTNINIKDLSIICEQIQEIPKKYLAIHIDNVEQCIQAHKSYYKKYMDIESNILTHNNIEAVHEYIEKLINNHGSITTILRLLSLMILTGESIDFEYYQREIIHEYGYQYLLIIEDMKKYGFFQQSSKLFSLKSSHIPLPTIIDKLIRKGKIEINGQQSFIHNKREKFNNTLIFVVGGLTYDEIDILYEKCDDNCQIATTSIISGNSIIKSFLPSNHS